ncbi:MAG TPA: SPOR domain-containing protein [Terriglobia bacterium]|nr:SPOR domain-containing protein [Terriglobia bacterium]
MGDESNAEREAKGLSASQMVVLFLAGAAVCAIFFSAGFVVGYNEKSSKAAPLTEQVSESQDVPPVVGTEQPRSAAKPYHAAPIAESPVIDPDQSEPVRPRPLSASANQAPDAHSRSEIESKPSPAAGPAKTPGMAPANNAASSHEASGAAGSIMIQVAATGTLPDGEKMVKTLKGMNYPAVLVSPQQARAGDNLYRIQVGPFPTRESAEKTKARLMQDGFKQPFIKH